MNLLTGEVVLIRVLYREGTGGKVRPAAVALDAGDDDFVAAPVTSQRRDSGYELALKDWRGAELNVPSHIRVHKLAVLAKADIVRRLGHLRERDREAFEALLCQAFCLRRTDKRGAISSAPPPNFG